MSASRPWCACDRTPANPRGIGSYQGDAIRNIVGSPGRTISGGDGVSGAFGMSSSGGGVSGSTTSVAQVVSFDASRVVPVGADVRPQNSAVAPVVLI